MMDVLKYKMMDQCFAPRDRIRLLTLEQHIREHEYSMVSANTSKEPGLCLVCRNILEHCSEGGEEEAGCCTSRSGVNIL